MDANSGEVDAIEVHDLVPRSHEVTHELVLRVVGYTSEIPRSWEFEPKTRVAP
jgi:hypothetical protein